MSGRCVGFLSSRSGAVAVEFALVSVVFFNILFSMMEIGLILFQESGVHNALREVARGIEVEDVNPMDTASLKSSFCKFSFIPDCETSGVLNLHVQILDRNISNMGTESWFDKNDTLWRGITPLAVSGNSGTRQAIIIRAWFSYPIILPYLRPSFVNHPDPGVNERLIGDVFVSVSLL